MREILGVVACGKCCECSKGVVGGTQKERVFFGWANRLSWRLLHSRSGSTAHAFLLIWNLFLIKKTKERMNESTPIKQQENQVTTTQGKKERRKGDLQWRQRFGNVKETGTTTTRERSVTKQ